MTLQLLHNLLGLQIPDIHQVIFRTRHNPLPACHGEVGKYAVLLILVASVCLQALPLAVVPELQCAERQRVGVRGRPSLARLASPDATVS